MMLTVSTHTDWIQTFTGRQFFPFAPVERDIDILDIAHSLSMQCRYVGHCNDFYSVAQHSVYVSQNCPPADALWGLLHDAAEAYLHDIGRPIKRRPEMQFYRDAENLLQGIIYQRFGLLGDEPPSVKQADNALLRTEQRDLMKPAPAAWEDNREGALSFRISSWTPSIAKRRFLIRYYELSGAGRGDNDVSPETALSSSP